MKHNPATLTLFLAHQAALIDYATPIVGDRAGAEDVVQEAYLRFDLVAAEGRALGEPVGYLYRIVRNLALDGRRRLMREARLFRPDGDGAIEAIAEDRPSPEAEALSRFQLRLLAEALDELPERTRIALEMHRFGGCKLREIAAELNISITLAHALVADGVDHCRRRVHGEK